MMVTEKKEEKWRWWVAMVGQGEKRNDKTPPLQEEIGQGKIGSRREEEKKRKKNIFFFCDCVLLNNAPL